MRVLLLAQPDRTFKIPGASLHCMASASEMQPNLQASVAPAEVQPERRLEDARAAVPVPRGPRPHLGLVVSLLMVALRRGGPAPHAGVARAAVVVVAPARSGRGR